MFSTDDCEGGPYFAETCEGHSDRAAYKTGNANILYILSVYLQ